MNKDTERSLWMAEKCYPDKKWTRWPDGGVVHFDSSNKYMGHIITFSLDNAKEQLAALIWLGEEHGISIRNPAGKWYFWHEDWFGDRKSINDDCQFFDTHKEALYAAIDYLMELK